jgi:hypothetical protein
MMAGTYLIFRCIRLSKLISCRTVCFGNLERLMTGFCSLSRRHRMQLHCLLERIIRAVSAGIKNKSIASRYVLIIREILSSISWYSIPYPSSTTTTKYVLNFKHHTMVLFCGICEANKMLVVSANQCGVAHITCRRLRIPAESNAKLYLTCIGSRFCRYASILSRCC